MPAVELTVAVFDTTLPEGVDDATATVSVKTATLPTKPDGLVHEMVPASPDAGAVHDQPAADWSDTNIVFAGSVSDSDIEAAASGPELVTAIV